MSLRLRLWIATLFVCCQGCSPITNTVRTLIIEPGEYCLRVESRAERKRDDALALVAWNEHLASCPDSEFTESFERGFKEGFADYLYAGGSGNPPPVPPRCYWGPKYETPEGHMAVEDWFAGFRLGSALAVSSGYRNLVTIPASTGLQSRNARATNPPDSKTGIDDLLPAPREVPFDSPSPAVKAPSEKTTFKPNCGLPGPRMANSFKMKSVCSYLESLAPPHTPTLEPAKQEGA